MTPWKIAMEAAAQPLVGFICNDVLPSYDIPPEVSRADVEMPGAVYAALRALPEPPAFRAAVEAEAERVKLAIAKRLDEEADMTPCAEDAGVIRGCAKLVRVDFSYDAAEALQAEAEELRGMLEAVCAFAKALGAAEKDMPIAKARALLSRLEAKGESHD